MRIAAYSKKEEYVISDPKTGSFTVVITRSAEEGKGEKTQYALRTQNTRQLLDKNLLEKAKLLIEGGVPKEETNLI
jgi:hypothetical protein